jgi:hypothetical protein
MGWLDLPILRRLTPTPGQPRSIALAKKLTFKNKARAPACRSSAQGFAFTFEPTESTKVILLPAAILRLHPEKSAHVNGHDADINCVVDRKEHEIISKDQRDMDQGADGEYQEMHQNLDV